MFGGCFRLFLVGFGEGFLASVRDVCVCEGRRTEQRDNSSEIIFAT